MIKVVEIVKIVILIFTSLLIGNEKKILNFFWIFFDDLCDHSKKVQPLTGECVGFT